MLFSGTSPSLDGRYKGSDSESKVDQIAVRHKLGVPLWASGVLSAECLCLQWYNQNAMLNAIASWGDRSYSQTVFNFMQGSVPSNGACRHLYFYKV